MNRMLLALASFLLCVCAQGSTVAQQLKDGVPVSDASITPSSGLVMVANGTAFRGSTSPTFNGVNLTGVAKLATANAFAVGGHTINSDGISITPTAGLSLLNGTASQVGIPQQYSPSLVFRGQGWGAGANKTYDWRATVWPTVGADTSSLSFEHSLNGAAYTTVGTLTSGGGDIAQVGKANTFTAAQTMEDTLGVKWGDSSIVATAPDGHRFKWTFGDATYNGVVDHIARWSFNNGTGRDMTSMSMAWSLEGNYNDGVRDTGESYISYWPANENVELRPYAMNAYGASTDPHYTHGFLSDLWIVWDSKCTVEYLKSSSDFGLQVKTRATNKPTLVSQMVAGQTADLIQAKTTGAASFVVDVAACVATPGLAINGTETIYASTKPTTRANGTALVYGDIWHDTTAGGQDWEYYLDGATPRWVSRQTYTATVGGAMANAGAASYWLVAPQSNPATDLFVCNLDVGNYITSNSGTAYWTYTIYGQKSYEANTTIYAGHSAVPAHATLNKVARTNNVATITTQWPHGFMPGSIVTVASSTGGTFDNAAAVVVATPTGTTFTYANAGGEVATTADTAITVASYAAQYHAQTWTVNTFVNLSYSGGDAPMALIFTTAASGSPGNSQIMVTMRYKRVR